MCVSKRERESVRERVRERETERESAKINFIQSQFALSSKKSNLKARIKF